MNTPTIALSRAELDIWGAEKLGWQSLRNTEEGLQGKRNGLTHWVPRPTRDIGEAWKLLPLALAAMTPEQSETFFQRWNDATLFDSTQEQAATWICCNVYAAVEGRAVELTD